MANTKKIYEQELAAQSTPQEEAATQETKKAAKNHVKKALHFHFFYDILVKLSIQTMLRKSGKAFSRRSETANY